MSIFSVPKNTITVKVDYIVKDDGFSVIPDRSFVNDEYLDQIKTAEAEFRHEGWDNFNRAMKSSIVKDPNTGDTVFDPITLRDVRLRRLIKSLVDGDGNTIEVNDPEIDTWDPQFCSALMTEYNLKTENKTPGIFKTSEESEEIFKDMIENIMNATNTPPKEKAEEKTEEEKPKEGE